MSPLEASDIFQIVFALQTPVYLLVAWGLKVLTDIRKQSQCLNGDVRVLKDWRKEHGERDEERLEYIKELISKKG